ncbi:bacillithiol biosynthesis cysteine-adding enzyme BshC [Lentibacillus sp. N15]|uniref:bacillithiol biosynthesis cysteine-adding enzyme BshC n=1 Tax=Lentibacillus songyuanensis TaxID=3136161 RepID=UPI0031B9E37A
MRINPISLQKQSKLINDYRNNEQMIMDFFDYHPFEQSSYQKRVQDLHERFFNREQLTKNLATINSQWDAPDSTHANINKLRDPNSVVVIGGQQAGLLTGPMYTINKVISIIQLARQQEEELSIPVVPVFWIAGEDHDFDEMNHIFLPKIPQMKKYKLPQQMDQKMPVSAIKKDDVYAKQWIDTLFSQLQETAHTKSLYHTIVDCLDKSASYVDFFARVIFELFPNEGVVLVDSAHPLLRQQESGHFLAMIDNQQQISDGVYRSEQRLNQLGYATSLGVQPDDAHLFYTRGDERILLTRKDSGEWVGKQNDVQVTTTQLQEIAEAQPELLSNNVVTRPLMQEMLFPTLAFIGGPGEISYWSALQPAFHALDMTMPPVVPRLSFTIIERHVEKLLHKYGVTPSDAVNNGVMPERGNWLAAQNNPPISCMADQLKRVVEEAHKPMQEVAGKIRADLGDLAGKNLDYIFRDIDYLTKRLNKELENKYAKELYEFDVIHASLHPNNGLQERVWNPLPWLNWHGNDFIGELTNKPCSFTDEHYLVYL